MLLGKKIGMTQIYDEQERLLPVTVVQAGPCVVMQVKTVDTDGYNAVQLGFEDVKASRRTKATVGHADKAKTAPKRFVREMRLADDAKVEFQPGDSMTVSVQR
jgi:large subunit ribosomal protein L3